MGNAGGQRRLKKERERQRERTQKTAGSSRPEPGSQPGQGRVPLEGELVSAAIVKAMDAVCRGIPDAYGEHLDELATERRPGWTKAVSLGLAGYLQTSVASAWQRGWQPAELVRQLGRELSPAHATLVGDMIAAEMSGYPAATVDARWAAQVAAIKADAPGKGAWWGSDAEYLGARYGRGLAAEFIAVVAVAVETLHAFQHLSALERLLPLPGTVRAAQPRNGTPGQRPAGQAPAGEAPADERMLGRIRALRAGGKRDSRGRSRTRAFRQSFLVSYAIRIGERLAEAAGQAEDEAVAEQRAGRGAGPAAPGNGTDLVPFLAAREQAVDDAVDAMFGPLTTSRGVRVSDEEGWADGRAAADLATLHGRTAVRPAGYPA